MSVSITLDKCTLETALLHNQRADELTVPRKYVLFILSFFPPSSLNSIGPDIKQLPAAYTH